MTRTAAPRARGDDRARPSALLALLTLLAGALLVAPTRTDGQELFVSFCNDTPLDFTLLVKWSPLTAGAPTNGPLESKFGNSDAGGCGAEWFVGVDRGNFRGELVGNQLFDELIFFAQHRVAPSTPDHSEPANSNVIVMHVDGGLVGQLPAAPNATDIPDAAMLQHDPAKVPSNSFATVSRSVAHPSKGHRDVGYLQYQTIPNGIQFIFIGVHTVPEPATLVLVATGLAGLGGAARLGRRRRG